MKSIFKLVADNREPGSMSDRFRRKRFSDFINLVNVSSESTILDDGGVADIWLGTGFESNVTLLNVSFPRNVSPFQYVIGDACEMTMFSDKTFDVVFSNSVIEHVGNWERQRQFAAEISRVGKKYWVQTPNKHFPIEPHFLFPLFQYLPYRMKKVIGMRWKYSHCRRNNENILEELASLRLLTISEMRTLFSDAEILREDLLGLTKSIIAFRV